MAAVMDITQIDKALKVLYADRVMQAGLWSKHPILALFPKKVFDGKNYTQPVRYSGPGGISPTHSSVEGAKNASDLTEFVITKRAKAYGAVDITAEAMMASASPEQFLEAKKLEIDGILEQMTKFIAKSLVGDGSGAVGTWQSESTVTTTLSEASDVWNFIVGGSYQLMVPSTGLAVSGAPVVKVVSTSVANGTVTFDTEADPSTAAVAGTSVFVQVGGLAGAAVTTSTAKFAMGLGAWLPATVTSTSFWGVDRTLNDVMLAGHRFSAGGATKAETIIRTGGQLAKYGASPDLCLTSFTDYQNLEIEMHNRVQYNDVKGDFGIGFTGLKFATQAGVVTVIPDANIPVGTAFMLDRKTWKILHLGGLPHIVQDDGMMAQRLSWSNNDGIEVRARAMYNLTCDALAYNARITW